MCGIIGYTGHENALPFLINGLRKLEYRGYDSSGVAIGGSQFTVYKKAGKLSALVGSLPKEIAGNCGLGHTRWATHGGVTDKNAHPFVSSNGKIVIVHNGIIENFAPLKESLIAAGFTFTSDTDSEVLANLIQKYHDANGQQNGATQEDSGANQKNIDILLGAVKLALNDVIGTYALGVMCVDCPGEIVAARRGCPVVVGLGKGAHFVASDVNAIAGLCDQVVYLEDGDTVLLSAENLKFPNVENNDYAKRVEAITISAHETEKNGFATYMEKEITEQVESVARAFAGRIDAANSTSHIPGFDTEDWRSATRLCMMSAGTSWYAACEGALLLEKYAHLHCDTEFSSELRYKNPVVNQGDVFMAISQSGETADTIYAMREVSEKGGHVYGICNVVSSTIARNTVGGAFMHAGPEIAVASTKAFSNTLVVLYLLTLKMARMRGMSREDGDAFIAEILRIPDAIKSVLSKKDEIHKLACKYARSPSFLFLARGTMYPIAMEGALKLKEISYIHAEALAAGEIKHGPIALVTQNVPSVFLVPDNFLRDKVISNIKEVKARHGPVIIIGTEGDTELQNIADDYIGVPHTNNSDFYAIPYTVAEQLFAFYCAQELGRDVDQPRNLAKSVTVE